MQHCVFYLIPWYMTVYVCVCVSSVGQVYFKRYARTDKIHGMLCMRRTSNETNGVYVCSMHISYFAK